ncbi:MAG: glycerol-3-phosphate dehydrogenase/oxidase [Okeania sp. SIO2D1]|uniref:glycerol-3-phosphate dehydrogenase/oxidase n=1 Tax=Okeania sp. SIO2C9 TaxID=2607791 RepID=UPI0013B5E93B|nr:glycerol-3-phosphate dehydrogenase/oxidase [Okeania sp. SIO2C9]NEQ76191.1 glycerol-3-phosphate dehydrogenase/oxidase [Okeania sp. SIO2C9]NES65347.1 glycerol-3-phosphate dehydrogenase/oxidase [Okeania sp. SIO2D1]
MERNLTELTNQVYDVLVIGGGIYGATLAREASLCGLSVALVEKNDFGAATSANSLKTIHGGLRYLQNADFKRMRESIHERTTLMRIAPHLIHPLPVLIPTYGHGLKGKEALSVALAVNDLVSCDRNRLLDQQKHIPNGRVISQKKCLELLPGISTQGLTGGAIFHDAQVYNSERLTISFLHSAHQAGASLANYVEVTGLVQNDNRINGVTVTDKLTENQFDIRAKTVINTCGAWGNKILGMVNQQKRWPFGVAKAMNLVTTRPLFEKYAVGITSKNSSADSDAIVNKGSRFLFISPWRGRSMIGTEYAVYSQDPDDFQITEADISQFMAAINQAYPPAKLKREEISFVHGGMLPTTNINSKTGEPILAKHYQIFDHSQTGLLGLISVVGVKYTTARDVAEKVVNYLFKLLGKKSPKSVSSVKSIYGGEIENFTDFLQNAIVEKRSKGLTELSIRRLVYNYGSAYPKVLNYLENPESEWAIVKAEILHAIHQEMAYKLSDVIFRRTELGSAGYPGDETIKFCAEVMSKELSWSSTKLEEEVQQIRNKFGITSAIVASNIPSNFQD